MLGLRAQPTAYAELVRQGMYLLIIFNVITWTATQQTAVLMFVSALLAVVNWNVVMPTQTVTQAGTTPEILKTTATANVAAKDLIDNTPPNP